MEITTAELEQAIEQKLIERQLFLDKANALTGAVAILRGQLADAKAADEKAAKKKK